MTSFEPTRIARALEITATPNRIRARWPVAAADRVALDERHRERPKYRAPQQEDLAMRIDQIMTQDVCTCRQDDSLERAAQLMWDRDCGCLPVSASDGATRVVGLITDRDICMCALFQHKPLSDIRVSEAMSKQVQACKPNDSITAAEKVMAQGQIRRLPVIDEQGMLVGIVSLSDVAREAEREVAEVQPEISGMEVGGTLAAICQPTGGSLAA
jgi:CBS domain-containing protein